MKELDLNFVVEVQAYAQLVDELDYFEILKVAPQSTAADIRSAYFRESRVYHPDLYFAVDDDDTKEAVGKIYKRINEAYLCLRDERKRARYAQDVSGADRARKLRYDENSEHEHRQAREQSLGQTPQGRRVFQQALLDLHAGRLQQAVQGLRMAVAFEPQNQFFKEKLDEVARQMTDAR